MALEKAVNCPSRHLPKLIKLLYNNCFAFCLLHFLGLRARLITLIEIGLLMHYNLVIKFFFLNTIINHRITAAWLWSQTVTLNFGNENKIWY